MGRVNTTVFSTPCCTRPPERRARRGVALRALLAGLLLLWLALPAARAQGHGGEVSELQLQRSPEGLYLSAALQLELPELVRDALLKGISIHFTTEAEVLRERWYWSDKVMAHATRYLRLSYQPLTRRWRLMQSPVPFAATGLGVSLGQNFDELSDALAAIQRVSRWKIAEPGVLDDDSDYTVRFEFRLDLSQLPRPLQIGAVGGSSWNVALSRSVRLPAQEGAR